MVHRLFARVFLLAIVALPASCRAGAQAPDYLAAGAKSPSSSPANSIASGIGVSVKNFGAVGDGIQDDTVALQNAFSWMATNGRCLYFPSGAYKTMKQLDWVNQYSAYKAKPLCLRGESWKASYIIYLGAAAVDATIHVSNTYPAQVMPALDIRDLGIAASAKAAYAFHAVTPGPSTIDNAAFAGGSVSSFEGDGWNGISDLRNLLVGPQFFSPAGSSSCINGITFSHAIEPVLAQDIPSSQFTLTAPLTVGCAGIGLNLSSTMGITINGGQSSSNHQNVYRNNPLGQPEPVIINGMLWEGIRDGDVANQILGGYAILNGILFNSEANGVQLSGQNNVVQSSTGIFTVLSGSTNTYFVNDVVYTGSTDAGTGTYGSGNLQQAGGNAPPPWNGLPSLQVRYATVLPSGTDLYSLTACGIYTVTNPVHAPPALASIQSRIQVLCDQSGNATSRTLIAQGIFDPAAQSNNTTYINTESYGKWQGWQQYQLSGDLITGYPTAPSGSCSTVGWIFSQDGHATFCNGTVWMPKI